MAMAMTRRLDELRAPLPGIGPAVHPRASRDLVDRLRSLGYIGSDEALPSSHDPDRADPKDCIAAFPGGHPPLRSAFSSAQPVSASCGSVSVGIPWER
jgi:hypothetical protein